MNIARALSVRDGKGAVSWVASQSRDGTDSRGNLVACVSGPEKSRQIKQEFAFCMVCGGCDDDAPTLGFVADILVRSGREDMGIGGGALPFTEGLGLGVLPSASLGLDSPTLFIPKERADLMGVGGGSRGGSFLGGGSSPTESCLVLLRGGSEGMTGGGGSSATTTLGDDLADFSGALPFPVSCVGVRLGGSGGKLDGS